ncbi:MAG TPA: DUF3592 domain-containing protein [Chthoniobacterales bacterium]|jgi:hypothetical protein|nr:DUF3592 domain-containing protein [Chthoniobacterales bacterium]
MLTLIFLIVFPFALYKAWKNVQMAKASVNWRTTTGKIAASEIKKVMFRRQPHITYTYVVNDKAYTSQRVSFAGGSKPKDVDPTLARYPVGSDVTVAHDPQNPAEAALETGANKQVTAQVRLLLICFVLIVAMNILSYYLKGLNRRSSLPNHSYQYLATNNGRTITSPWG